MNCPNDPTAADSAINGYTVRRTVPADAPDVDALFAERAFPGAIRVLYGREPSVLASLEADSDSADGAVVVVCRNQDSLALAGMGACLLRREWFNGELRTTGYLTALKRAKGQRRAMAALPLAYGFLHRLTRESCPFYYTTILTGNEPALRLLDRPHPGLPPYTFLSEYTVFVLGTRRPPRPPAGYELRRGWDPAVAAFYAERLPRFNCAPSTGRLVGTAEDDYYSLRDSSGAVVAAGALWDQRATKQYTIEGYAGAYRLARLAPLRALGYPAMPPPGRPAAYASLAAVVVAEAGGDDGIGGLFLRLLATRRPELEFVLCGLADGHPLVGAARALRHLSYTSRLYAVDFPGNPAPDGRPFMLEVALL
ncbi:MAG: hypothetical protein LBG60_08485 [Bifidobacteriaceae bacterium]|jgi:hypothetical protein|nr:hypothetical protein [Bifidobacteriaceae bacterium]